MKVWAVTVVRDEQDVIGLTLRHMLDEGVDGILVCDQGSVDLTRDIVDSFRDEGVLLSRASTGFNQGAMLTNLARAAHANVEPDWIIPFDADEWWYSDVGTIKEALEFTERAQTGSNLQLVPFYNHYPTGEDPTEGNAFERLPWRWSNPHGHKKACRSHADIRIGQGSHEIFHPRPLEDIAVLKIHHFPWRSLEHYRRKVERGRNLSGTLWSALRYAGDSGFDQFFFECPWECERWGWPSGKLVRDPVSFF